MTHRKAPGQPGKPDQSGETDDELIPDWLERRFEEAPGDEPPALLDQAVMNRARAAVDRPAASRRPWSFGWVHAATTTAVIVLGATVMFQLRDQAPGTGMPPPIPAENGPGIDYSLERTSPTSPSPAAASSSANEEEAPATMDVMSARELKAKDEAQPAADNDAARRVQQRQASPAAADVPAIQESQQFELKALVNSPPENATPDDVLAQIETLIEQGDLEQARALSEAFRERWPEQEIPAVLLKALEP